MGNWYILRNNLQYGPYTTEQMLSMEMQGQLFTGDVIFDSATQQNIPLEEAQRRWHSMQGGQYRTPGPVSGKAQKKARKKLSKKARRIAIGTAVLLAALVLGLAIWKAGDVTGFWLDRQIEQASSEWKKQPGFSKEESEIKTCLKNFADALEKKDLAAAMTFVYSDEQQNIQALLTKEDAKIPALVAALKNVEISYLSTDSGNYAALRMATVTVGKTKTGSATSSGFTIVLVKTEEGWVVSSL